MTPLKAQAIQTALMGDWENAILLNQSLLEENPNDIDTLNRLAYALASVGNIQEAKAIYQKVLDLDTQNPIALRNLKRLNSYNASHTNNRTHVFYSNLTNLFIEEPGKTKVLDLLNVADKKVLTLLRSGEPLTLCIKRMKIFMLDQNKQYIGMLPDDVGRRLIRFIKGGNQYDAYIKSVDNNKVTIFIREIKRVARFKNQPSFPSIDKTRLFIKQKPFEVNDYDEDAGSED